MEGQTKKSSNNAPESPSVCSRLGKIQFLQNFAINKKIDTTLHNLSFLSTFLPKNVLL